MVRNIVAPADDVNDKRGQEKYPFAPTVEVIVLDNIIIFGFTYYFIDNN